MNHDLPCEISPLAKGSPNTPISIYSKKSVLSCLLCMLQSSKWQKSSLQFHAQYSLPSIPNNRWHLIRRLCSTRILSSLQLSAPTCLSSNSVSNISWCKSSIVRVLTSRPIGPTHERLNSLFTLLFRQFNRFSHRVIELGYLKNYGEN